MDISDKFLQLALLGADWVLWVLVALSFASVAIVIERWLFYRDLGSDDELVNPLNGHLAEGELEEAEALLKDRGSAGARMVRAMLARVDSGATALQALMAGSRGQERIRLERNLSFLGTVGSNAPFIGLFGTVLEILKVFSLLGAQGVTSGDDAAGIMTGISEALVATAVGLLVAIPAVIFYNAFQRRVKRLMSSADGLANMALAQLADRGTKASTEG